MIRLKAYLPGAICLVFTALLCALLTPQVTTFAGHVPELFSRAIGFALLGVAAAAIVLVFRSLPTRPATASARVIPINRDSEFRRGFAKTPRGAAHRTRVEPRLEGPAEVIVLRRPSHAKAPAAAPAPLGNIEILKRRLQYRAEALWRRRAG
jgi:hypothetical protein